MKKWLNLLLALSALALGSGAHAQSCASGGGATVCLTASGNASNVQLSWTVSGTVSGVQVMRDTDSNPSGRTRLATVASTVLSYTDSTAVAGTPYWYWIKFTAGGTSYNAGPATATRSSGTCTATAVTPNIAVAGTWTASSTATAAAGTAVSFGPQPATGGSWSWSGCGLSGTARQQDFTAKATCTATVVYTNSCGAKTTQAFTLTVPGMRDLTSVQLSRLMGAGWNLGNSLEAIGGETAWGNPATTQTLISAVKAAGFKSIRIPLSWKQYADANDNISATWMARVTQVVNYARTAGLYTVINVHWDGGWMVPTYAQQATVNARLTKFWTQIANNFKSYDDTLLFAGTNETAIEGVYTGPTAENAAVQNSFNQTFVNAVRATGGNNLARHLVVQGYATNIDNSVAYTTVPTDSVASRLFMELHYYDPYNFTINSASTIWQWGSIATDATATETWANEAYVDAQFQKLKTRYVDQGVPILLGEFGAMYRTQYSGSETYRNYWTKYVTASAWARGAVPMWWDNGVTGNFGMGLFNRSTGAQVFPTLISTLVNAAK